MAYIDLDYTSALGFIHEKEMYQAQETVTFIHDRLHQIQGKMLGWVDLPAEYDRAEFRRIQEAAAKIQKQSDVLLVIGVGGSYLGARAAIEMLNHHFYNDLPPERRKTPQIYYVGHHFSPVYIAELAELLRDQDFSINVISKSGTTMEPAIAFRIFRNILEEKYGKAKANERIFVTTDRKQGVLKTLADQEGYETFVIPDNIGGRYSVLTPVGLLPIAVSGVDLEQMMAGAELARSELNTPLLNENTAYQYAVIRNLLYKKGKTIELFVHYEPCLHFLAEWWKQLFGESEGKQQQGIFPAAVEYSTDLHSLGQYVQEGRRELFETVIKVQRPALNVTIEKDHDNMDGLNFLSGKTLDYINKQALEGVRMAHTDGGVPNLLIDIPQINAFTFGYLVYFLKKACAMSGHLHGVNPFDQSGVEKYKTNMFALLEKPGYEQRMDELKQRYLGTFEKV
ncbi:glucose-6-phosphate isomerase [Siminovitchia sediminis]|uniref:Glucose-6-phosphate isomerase n=1 Tax=Siminovitchia sediminis TaxID=1274353 RepID=A0ABW4KIZ0_9BACI